ncbi:hypothetical protein [Parablautia sp. Marseille-Q6255]|uniref:hypothetical protein n=1 Tax=Parablautia sp. Marseille-Q6255 TaxID=3039593 RepID=UPI0024BCEE45|nr:hypothetical protein [Parablautia sp. Marseille-Q6255]
MTDEERVECCQREIFRLRNVVRNQYTLMQQFEEELIQAMEETTMPGLSRALEIWKQVTKDA